MVPENMRIQDIEDPTQRLLAFIDEREGIRQRRISGKPWPWTQNEILQTYRFTNVHREDDAVSRHYQKTIRKYYQENPIVIPATVLYRWFNRPETCDYFFNQQDFYKQSPFERYLDTNDLTILTHTLSNIPRPHVTGAYIITGKPGYAKGEGVLQYFHEWCQRPWKETWGQWHGNPPMLWEMDEWLNGEGLGTFMRAQLVADLKYLYFLQQAEDWWTWASPGPGSRRGLNVIYDRPMDMAWNDNDWLVHLVRLNQKITPTLEEMGIGRLHNQDLQNCLCEFSKFTKVARGTGRPRQTFKHR